MLALKEGEFMKGSVSEQILKMAEENNGFVTSAQISEAGILRGNLKNLTDKGLLERSARGVYVLPEVFEDEFINLQTQFKKGIFSGETALFLHGYSDRTPLKFRMTFPAEYNTTMLRAKNVIFVRTKESLYNLGVCNVKTPGGNTVKAYNLEKTLCDILRGSSHTDIQSITDAYKKYARSETRNIPLLSEYAKKLHVEKKVRSYLEALL